MALNGRVIAQIQSFKTIVNKFDAGKANGIETEALNKQGKSFTVSKLSTFAPECPAQKAANKAISFMQLKQNNPDLPPTAEE